MESHCVVTELAALPSLGLVSARMLIEADIPDVDTLRRLGVIECYRRLRFHHCKRATLNFAYALECAIHGLHWRDLSAERKAEIKAQARAIEAVLTTSTKKRRAAKRRGP